MKIVIIGFAGSGKSTLAIKLSKKYNLSVLHMDKISFYPNWVENTNEERIALLSKFLLENPNGWVIDGNYSKVLFDRRMEEADEIIFLKFNRLTCYLSAKKRAKMYKGKNRESAPDGCEENFSRSFRHWILFEGRRKNRTRKFAQVLIEHKNKIKVFKNRRQVNKYLEELEKANYVLNPKSWTN